MIKKVMMSLVLVASALTAQAAGPKPYKTTMPLPEMIAIATAHTLNRLGTVDNFTKWISKRVPENEMVALKANFPKMGITPDMAFPTITAKGNKVYFDKDTFFTVNKNSIVMNGKTFKTSDKTYDVLVLDLYTALVKGKVAAYSMFMPQANAEIPQQAKSGLVGMGLGAILGYFAGPSLGIDKTTAAVGGASLGGLGGLFLGAEDHSWVTGMFNGQQSGGSQPQITCYGGGYYQVCNSSGGTYYGNNSSCQIMSSQSVEVTFGYRCPPCSQSSIPGYQQTYNNYGNNYYPTRSGPPAGAVQVTQ